MRPDSDTTSASAPCYFLHTLPAELRIVVYDNLLLADRPVKGKTSRGATRYGLHPVILRVNRQIYDEAHPVFFRKNTFYISSIPDVQPTDTQEAVEGPAPIQYFDPPIQSNRWKELRHIVIDLLYYPADLVTQPASGAISWQRVDLGAAAYVSALTTVLNIIGSNLLSLELTADAEHVDFFCAKKCLASFFMCDRDRSFARAIAHVDIETIPFSFEFPDCYFRTAVAPDIFMTRSILLLACQVMFDQSQVRINKLLAAFDSEDAMAEVAINNERTDLGPVFGKGFRF
ncbi:hypothetical protein BDV95DRAFT_490829 [Massariosphaeria phaeospora]|uniref:Uncharacterized protein n=1 Tax=Massariosphaeria phaeospora TaxID=100035 RepID=A0A7C8ICZ9_9PLEO|nr:hypothetical protein BDV95DRAFT_490829 [Massariosphaeria phaeospora]